MEDARQRLRVTGLSDADLVEQLGLAQRHSPETGFMADVAGALVLLIHQGQIELAVGIAFFRAGALVLREEINRRKKAASQDAAGGQAPAC